MFTIFQFFNINLFMEQPHTLHFSVVYAVYCFSSISLWRQPLRFITPCSIPVCVCHGVRLERCRFQLLLVFMFVIPFYVEYMDCFHIL